MENSSPQSYIRIENSKFGNRGIICVGIGFFISLLACIIVGATGPSVIQSRRDSLSVLEVSKDGNAEWNGEVNDMVQLNQLFWLSVSVYRPHSTTDEIGVIDTFVNVTGYESLLGSKDEIIFFNRHSKHSVYCQGDECTEFYIFGQSTIRHRSYDVHIRFHDIDSKFLQSDGTFEVLVELHTINSEYSKFELGWKSFFCFMTLIVLFLPREGFAFKLMWLPFSTWSYEQTWIMVLSACLFFFDDPFFSAQLYTRFSDSFAIFYILATSTFISVLLLFWLSALNEMRLSATGVESLSLSHSGWNEMFNFNAFYGLLLLLVGSIWTILVSSFIYIRTERKGDPTYEGLDDWVLRNVEIALVVLISLYIIWLFAMLVLSCSKILRLSTPFKFLFAFTMCIYIAVFTGLFAGYFYPLATSATVFLSFYGIINFYVWTLAFAFAPVGTDEGYSKADMNFGEDYFDEFSSLQEEGLYEM